MQVRIPISFPNPPWRACSQGLKEKENNYIQKKYTKSSDSSVKKEKKLHKSGLRLKVLMLTASQLACK